MERVVWSWQGLGGHRRLSELVTPEQRPKVRFQVLSSRGVLTLLESSHQEPFLVPSNPSRWLMPRPLWPVEAPGSPRDCSQKGASQETCVEGKLFLALTFP